MARPKIEITERDRTQIEIMAGLGLTVEQIAAILNISKRTFHRWCSDPEVLALYKKGLSGAEMTIAKSLFDKAKAGDTTAIIWYEKTRANRREVTQIEVVDERVKEELRDFMDFLRSQLPAEQFNQLINDYAARRNPKRVSKK
ncbi:MAG: hypothetical protein DCF32_10670 [Leptolyngbya sp.]|nr:MAG: hypothetical protein DCF32_10670 [Leptolyngbya sp.]